MSTYKENIIKHMEFIKVSDTTYNASIDETLFIDIMADIVKGFTLCENGTFSPIMDIPLSEEIISRIIADAFIFMHREKVEDSDSTILINFSVSEISYKIAIANNSEKLGGIVYGMVA